MRTVNSKIVIRDETDADAKAISEVTAAAFKNLEISHHTEHYIIAALRAADALSVSLVAEADHRVIGHIAFSPLRISDGTRAPLAARMSVTVATKLDWRNCRTLKVTAMHRFS